MAQGAGQTSIPVSVAFSGGRRQVVNVEPRTTWPEFKKKVCSAFGVSGSMSYIDEEGDKVALDSQDEFSEALKVAQKLGKLQLNVMDSKTQQVGREKKVGTTTTSDSTSDANPYILKFTQSMEKQSEKPKPLPLTDQPPLLPLSSTDQAARKLVQPIPRSPVLGSVPGHQRVAGMTVKLPPSLSKEAGLRQGFKVLKISPGTTTSPPQSQPPSKEENCYVNQLASRLEQVYKPTTPVEGVRQGVKALKISPDTNSSSSSSSGEENLYVGQLESKLKQCYEKKASSTSCVQPTTTTTTKEPFQNPYVAAYHRKLVRCQEKKAPRVPPIPKCKQQEPFQNPYVAAYQQKLMKCSRCSCHSSRPNHYVAKINHKLSHKYHQLGSAQTSSLQTNKTFLSKHAKVIAKRIEKKYLKLATAEEEEAVMEWLESGAKKQSKMVAEEVQNGLENLVSSLSLPPHSHPHSHKSHHSHSSTLPPGTGPAHCGVKCDKCDCDIVGVRYKCGNCSDYDLCEKCEVNSDQFHPPDHLFVKVKVPCKRLGRDKSGMMRPLLPLSMYSWQDVSEDQIPLLQSDVMSGGDACCFPSERQTVTRHKDELEEIKAAKKRRKKEKYQQTAKGSFDPSQLEAKLEELEAKKRESLSEGEGKEHVPSVTFQAPTEGEGKEHVPSVTFQAPTDVTNSHDLQKLDCQLVTDTSYPQGSSLQYGVPFKKGWILKNSGCKKWKHTKLVYQDGYKPRECEVDLPVLYPGESVEVTVQYSAVQDTEMDVIQSTWRLIRKGTTPFGPALTVTVILEKPPQTLSPSPPPVPQFSKPLTNEDLLKSIGFLPSENRNGEEECSIVVTPSGDGVSGPQEEEEEGAAMEDRESSSEQLFQAFELVDKPSSSIISLSSSDSLQHSALLALSSNEAEEMEMDAVSDSDSEFVVVIPDCFNLDIPFSGPSSIGQPSPPPSYSDVPPPPHDKEEDSLSYQYVEMEDGSCDYAATVTSTSSHDVDTNAQSQSTMPSAPPLSSLPRDSNPRPKPELPDQMVPEKTIPNDVQASNTSPKAGHREFVPKPITLRNVKDARITNPLKVATGLVNTVTHFVEGLSRPGKGEKSEGEQKVQQEALNAKQPNHVEEEEDDDKYVDASAFPEPSAPPEESSWTQYIPEAVNWLSKNVSEILPSHDDVSHLFQQQWEGPPTPEDPVEKLVAMGFGNRERNRELLQKHNYEMQPVINELLDLQQCGTQHWASTRH